jgi:multidrug efflux pump subunit AcrB
MLAIAASLIVALTVTPAMCAWLLPKMATREARPTGFALWLLDRYGRILRRVIERPRLVFGISGMAAVLAMIAIPFIGGRFLPEFRERSLIAHVWRDESMRRCDRRRRCTWRREPGGRSWTRTPPP